MAVEDILNGQRSTTAVLNEGKILYFSLFPLYIPLFLLILHSLMHIGH